VPHDIKDDRVAVVVGVERVEDVARLDVEPTEVTGSAGARHDADARRITGIPPVGHVRVPAYSLPDHRHDRVGYPDPTDERREH
jgi:hypothetical protein